MTARRSRLPAALYTAEQCRALDKTAIESFGIPGYRLMQRAGHALWDALIERWATVKSLTILAGAGNNGGDGFVVAAKAKQQGLDVQLLVMGSDTFADKLTGEAADAWLDMREQGVVAQPFTSESSLRGEVVVDALLGTGLSGEVRSDFAAAIGKINCSGLPVVAVDIPSGLCADTGRVLGCAVKADLTVTFIGLKRGLLTGQAPDYVGELQFDDLRVPDEVYETQVVECNHFTERHLARLLPRRTRSAHKGSYGHVLVVGGCPGMGGAAIIAAEAAMRAGAGLVSLATDPMHLTAALSRNPALMVSGVRNGAELQSLIERADVIVAGPGLGRGAWGEALLAAVLAADKPLVLDADAINLMVSKDWLAKHLDRNWVLTPHPGEAARIDGGCIASIENDRFASVNRLQRKCSGTVLLKGAGTLVAGRNCWLSASGNPGMATAGMGDLLSGIIGALIAQGLDPENAAICGAWLHGRAGDLAAKQVGEYSLQPTDLLQQIGLVIDGRQ